MQDNEDKETITDEVQSTREYKNFRWGRDFSHPSTPVLGPTPPHINGYRVLFPVVRHRGCDVNHPPPSSVKVKEKVDLYLYSPSGPLWPVLWRTLPYFYIRLFLVFWSVNSLSSCSALLHIAMCSVAMISAVSCVVPG